MTTDADGAVSAAEFDVAIESMNFGFRVAPARGPEPTAETVRSHPAYVGRVGSFQEWTALASMAVLFYGALYAEPRLMTRRSMAATRRLRSEQRRVARRAARRPVGSDGLTARQRKQAAQRWRRGAGAPVYVVVDETLEFRDAAGDSRRTWADGVVRDEASAISDMLGLALHPLQRAALERVLDQ